MRKWSFLLVVSLILSSCAAMQAGESRDPASRKGKQKQQQAETLDSPDEIEKILAETNPVFSEADGDIEKVPLHIPIEINRNVAKWIKFFAEKERERTTRYFERGEAMRHHIERILKENEMPPELYYLAMIESGFVTHAKSRAKAVGVWQFMPGTGRNYGLAVNNNVDERRNWIKSTEAAASYLKDLNNVFGSWYLALAAYNAGEHRIVRSIMKGKTRDFWALAEAGLLPQETLNYVPKFLAAHIVGKNMKRFGFDITVPEENRWGHYDTVTVPSGARLTDLARVTGAPIEALRRWNLDLLKGVTPSVRGGSVDIYVPKEYVANFESKKDEIAKLKRFSSGPAEEREYASASGRNDGYQIYIVRKGDNLSSISKKIGTSVRTIMKVNGLKKGRIHPGQRLKYLPPSSTARGKKSNRAVAADEKKKKRN